MSGCTASSPSWFTINTAEAWRRGTLESLEANESGLQLTSSGEHDVNDILASTDQPAEFQPVALAAGSCSIVYFLSADSPVVWRCDTNLHTLEPLRDVSHVMAKPRSIATFERRWILGADDGATRLAATDIESGQIHWLFAGDVAATDIVTGPGGSVFVLDRAAARVSRFEVDGAATDSWAVPVTAGSELANLRLDAGANLYVLDRGARRILKRPLNGQFSVLVNLDFAPGGFAIDRDGSLLVGEASGGVVASPEPRRLHRIANDGPSLGFVASYIGPGDLISAAHGGLLIYRIEDRRLVQLTPSRTFLRPNADPPPKGEYLSAPFDSTRNGTEWHRLTMCATIPDNTLVQVRWFASDAPVAPAEGQWTAALANPSDTLLHDEPRRPTKGRYLWLRLVLIGTEQQTPVVRRVDVHFPRNSYLRYLPAIYQEDPASREFLARFLSLFESLFTGVEKQTDSLARCFDPVTVPAEFLKWLSGWLALAADPSWTPERVRQYLLEAPQLYRMRGTRAGISRMVELYCGETPFIVEQHLLACAKEPQVLEVYRRVYGADPFCFCVLLRGVPDRGSAAKGHLTPGWVTTKDPLGPSDEVELIVGAKACRIKLGLTNHLEGLRDAIRELDLGIRARIARLPSDPNRYTIKVRARRLAPLALSLRLTPGDPESNVLRQTDPGSLPRRIVASEEDRSAIVRMLAAEKPAHTCAGLHVLEPRILLDMHSYVEINSVLSHQTPMLDRGAAMPLDSVLADRSSQGRVESHARVSLDAELG